MDTDMRITELESRIAHQDLSSHELSDEVFKQQRHLTELESKYQQLTERLQSVASAGPAANPSDEVPPHY
jgi:SlyX protein